MIFCLSRVSMVWVLELNPMQVFTIMLRTYFRFELDTSVIADLGSHERVEFGANNDTISQTWYTHCFQLFDGVFSIYQMLSSASAYCLPLPLEGESRKRVDFFMLQWCSGCTTTDVSSFYCDFILWFWLFWHTFLNLSFPKWWLFALCWKIFLHGLWIYSTYLFWRKI